MFLLYSQLIFNLVFNKVVLRIYSLSLSTFFSMKYTLNTQYSRFLHCPVDNLFTKLSILWLEYCKELIWAHRQWTCEDSPVIVQWLITSNKCYLLSWWRSRSICIITFAWLSCNFSLKNREDKLIFWVKSWTNTLICNFSIFLEGTFFMLSQRFKNIWWH